MDGHAYYAIVQDVLLAIGYAIGGKATMTTLPLVTLLWIPFFSTFLEAISPFGLDNIVVPLFIVVAFNSLAS